MEWWVHRSIGAAHAAGVATLAHGTLPGWNVASTAALIGVAWLTSNRPDKVERKRGWGHRTKGHYLSTALTYALVPATVAAFIGLGLGMLLVEKACAGDVELCGQRRALVDWVSGLGVLIAGFWLVGALCGNAMHTLWDSLTLSGSPLFPWKHAQDGSPCRAADCDGIIQEGRCTVCSREPGVRCVSPLPKHLRMRWNGPTQKLIGVLMILATLVLIYVQADESIGSLFDQLPKPQP